jgi:hypothetical protein
MANPYGSLILNDLHHYFPDLLYQPQRFQNVQDVLGYIVQIAQRNSYDHLRNTYNQNSSSESDSKETYEFNRSSSAYSVQPPTQPAHGSHASHPAHSMQPSQPSEASNEFFQQQSVDQPASNASTEAEQLLRTIFQRRSIFNPISRPPANRFRISMPLDLSNYYSVYSSQSPDILQTLSQLSSDLLRPVIVRPTEEQLAQNTYVYRSEVSHNENCSICQDPMEAGQETRTILACSHCFHRECIDRWFQENVRCPTCRHDVRESH